MAMASSSSKKIQIVGDEYGGEQRIVTSLDSTRASNRLDRALEEQGLGVVDKKLDAHGSWFKPLRFISLCCSSASSSNPSTPPPSSSNPNSTASPPSSASWYHSTRIQRMIEKRGEFRTEVESEIEASKVHWSQLDTATVSETDHSGVTNREYFEVLKRRRYVLEGNQLVFQQIPEHEYERVLHDSLFGRELWWNDLVVGEKLAEGGQAEIYAATSYGGAAVVVKVFKGESSLQDLENHIPPALLKWHQREEEDYLNQVLPFLTFGATLLTDERFKDKFAFVMDRAWGDLRKLIDHQMMHSSCNQGPPFTSDQILDLMFNIARDMKGLHAQCPPILHKDLKAANVLVERDSKTDGPYLLKRGSHGTTYLVSVVDWECSLGVVGTGLWRAPEILLQLKEKVLMSDLKVTEKCDVYSYGMTCYEVVTGRIPYEDYDDHFNEVRDLVLDGERPKLPLDLDPLLKGIITCCWDANPSERPSFEDIYENLDRRRKDNCEIDYREVA